MADKFMMNNMTVANLIVEELIRLGVTHFIISPGSRSTPLSIAVARHPQAKTTIHYDERGAAFFALGNGRATGVPAVLVCTSGTAVANYFPAVVEASMDNVPLIVLSADRPPELIDVGANQAIFQQDIYGVYPRLALNSPPPDSEMAPSKLLSQIDELFDTSVGNRPGPVHLNCQFREPLLPEISNLTEQIFPGSEWEHANSRYTPTPDSNIAFPQENFQIVLENLGMSKQGLIIVGRSVDNGDNQDILHLAEALGMPVFPDIQSQLRFTEHSHIINHFDLALLSDEVQRQQPDFIIHFGGPVTSKRLLNYVNQSNIFYISVKNTPERIDPNHQVTVELHTGIKDFCREMRSPSVTQDSVWLKNWQHVEKRTALSVSKLFDHESVVSEPGTSYQLSRLLPEEHALMLGNSMSIREMEMFASPGHFKGKIVANRGSSGIDGLLATAAGYGTAVARPVTVLIGDLAFLHDLNSLQLIKTSELPIIIVVINNDGGGIFSFLPVKRETDVFETFFGTPHGLTLEHAAHMFGLSYASPTDRDEFEVSYKRAVRESESTIIELVTDREENHHFHEQIFEMFRESS